MFPSENLNLKAVTVIDYIVGWSEIVEYDDNYAITITNKIKYDKG